MFWTLYCNIAKINLITGFRTASQAEGRGFEPRLSLPDIRLTILPLHVS